MLSHLNRQFQFSWYISGPTIVLALLMCRLSYWQWHRHLEKLELKQELENRLKLEPLDLNTLLSSALLSKASYDDLDWSTLIHRRVWIEGRYDFDHEMVLRNRRHNNQPGTFLLTPLRFNLPRLNDDLAIIVNRGFVPLNSSDRKSRVRFQTSRDKLRIVALLKPNNSAHLLAPADPPTGTNHPWVDAWLRVDLKKMGSQLPFKLLPLYAEEMSSPNLEQVQAEIFKSKSDRNEILNLAARSAVANPAAIDPLDEFPIPQNDLIIPPGRHLGYVFEWLILALLTCFISFILQTKKCSSV